MPLITLRPHLISPTHLLKPKTHLKNPPISAKWAKKRPGSRNNKPILNAITAVASHLKIFPEPLDSLLKEFCVLSGGGKGGNFGFKFGFGGADNGGKRSGGKKLGFWVVLVVSCGLAMWVLLEKGDRKDLSFLVLCVVCGLVGLRMWRSGVKDWVLGFSCGVALMGFGLRDNVDFVNWVGGVRDGVLGSFGVGSRKRRRGRRWI